MSRIRMHVFISNESDATLTVGRDEIASGDYTPNRSPPPVITPDRGSGFKVKET